MGLCLACPFLTVLRRVLESEAGEETRKEHELIAPRGQLKEEAHYLTNA